MLLQSRTALRTLLYCLSLNAGCYRCAKELPHRCAFMRDSASNSANAGSVLPHLGADHARRLGGSAALYLCRCYPHCCMSEWMDGGVQQ